MNGLDFVARPLASRELPQSAGAPDVRVISVRSQKSVLIGFAGKSRTCCRTSCRQSSSSSRCGARPSCVARGLWTRIFKAQCSPSLVSHPPTRWLALLRLICLAIAMLSTALRTGHPLPQISPCPLLDRFMEHHHGHGLHVPLDEEDEEYGLPRAVTMHMLEDMQYLCVLSFPVDGLIVEELGTNTGHSASRSRRRTTL